MTPLSQPLTNEKKSQTKNGFSSPHLEYVDGLRACAAICVMLVHSANYVPLQEEPAATLIHFFSFFARLSVDLFIVISGFCLMLPVAAGNGLLRGGVIQFSLRRARRILPPYYLSMGLSLLLIHLLIGHKTGTHWDVCLPVTKKAIIGHLFLIQNVYGAPKINHVFWSVAVEWQIYFLFPLLVFLGRRFGVALTTFTAVVLSCLCFSILLHTKLYGLTANYIGLFALGMLGATVVRPLSPEGQFFNKHLPWRAMTWGIGLLLLISIRWPKWHTAVDKFAFVDLLAGMWAVCLLITVSLPRPSFIRKGLVSKPLVFVGTFSYSLYLVHGPVQQVVWQYIIKPLGYNNGVSIALLASIGSVIAISFAFAFFLICEQPFMSRHLRVSQSQELTTSSPSTGLPGEVTEFADIPLQNPLTKTKKLPDITNM